MRNFSKSLISMAAVMAVGSAMAAGAMAETLTNINYADDTVTFSGVTPGKSQYTLLVVEGTKAADATEYTYDATEATIKQIDQNDAGVAFTEAVVGELADGSYKVLVGNNDGTIDSGIFEVSSAPVVPEVKYEPIKVGDANGDNSVNLTDATCVLNRFKKRASNPVVGTPYYTGNAGNDRTKEDGNKHKIGDANGDNSVNLTDATCILNRFKKRASNPVVGTPYYTGDAGNEIKVAVE